MSAFAVSFTHAVSLAVLAGLEARGLHRPGALAEALEESEAEAASRLRRLAGGGHAYPEVLDDVAVIAAALLLPIDVSVSADGSQQASAPPGVLPWAAAGDALAARCDEDGLWDPHVLADATGLETEWVEELVEQIAEGRAPIGDIALAAERLGVKLAVAVRIGSDVVAVDGAE